MLKVNIYTANHFPRLGGLEYSTHFLAKELNRMAGVKTSVICSRMKEVPLDYPYPYKVFRPRTFSFFTPLLIAANQRRSVNEARPDILHGQSITGGGKEVIKLARKYKLPAVVYSRGSDVQVVNDINYGESLNPQNFKLIKEVLRESDHIIALSTKNKNDILNFYPDEKKISIINNGIQYDEIQKIPFINIRQELNIGRDDFLIATVGRNSPVKRLSLLFEALAILSKQTEVPVKCICVGPEKNLRKIIPSDEIRKNIILTGPVHGNSIYDEPPYPHLINILRNANVYISTSYVESFGNSAAEALTCGTPVIVGKLHGVLDIIKPEKTGFVMQEETADELAGLIINIYNRRKELSEARQSISQSVSAFTWQSKAEEIVKIYNSLI